MNTFTSILVDIDATATAQPALERAAEIARKCGAPLRVVDVISAPAEARRVLREDLEDELMARRRERLARLAYGPRLSLEATCISQMSGLAPRGPLAHS